MSDSQIINIDTQFNEALAIAKKIFLSGGIFIYPTDTIYGVGANPFNEEAVKKVNAVKERDIAKMYILLINNLENLVKYVELNSEYHFDFLLSLWPNPVSVVLNLNSKARQLLGRDTAAFRIPNHRFCQKFLTEINMPLISTSVNRSNKSPLLEPSLIIDEFSSEVDAIFYTEKKSFFESSTIIDLTSNKPLLIREGKINFEDLIKKYEIQRS
jgi:L-threonylcarbamoyladenylate synthase